MAAKDSDISKQVTKTMEDDEHFGSFTEFNVNESD